MLRKNLLINSNPYIAYYIYEKFGKELGHSDHIDLSCDRKTIELHGSLPGTDLYSTWTQLLPSFPA